MRINAGNITWNRIKEILWGLCAQGERKEIRGRLQPSGLNTGSGEVAKEDTEESRGKKAKEVLLLHIHNFKEAEMSRRSYQIGSQLEEPELQGEV